MPYITTPNEVQTITTELWTSAPSAKIMLQLLSQSGDAHKLLSYEHHFRFFAASCARRTSYLLTDSRSRIAIQTAELFANSRSSAYALHKAYVNAKAAILEQAKNYNTLSSPSAQQSHPTGVSQETLYGAAVLHAAAAAATCCFARQVQTPLGVAEACAKYATKALYWEQISLGADKVLISQLIDEEEHRQAHTLRIFIGNPFAPLRFPPMNLHSSNPMSQQESCTQQFVNAA
jgi:hypothetical protein